MQDTRGALLQNFFIYDASNADNPSCELIRLPTCTLPDIDEHTRLSCHRRCRPPPPPGVEYRRVMNLASMGVLSRGEGERDFAVAELNFFYPDAPVSMLRFMLTSFGCDHHLNPELMLLDYGTVPA